MYFPAEVYYSSGLTPPEGASCSPLRHFAAVGVSACLRHSSCLWGRVPLHCILPGQWLDARTGPRDTAAILFF